MEERAIKSWLKENRPPVEELSSLGQEAPSLTNQRLALGIDIPEQRVVVTVDHMAPSSFSFRLPDSVGTFGPGEDIHSQCQDLHPVSSRLLAAADNKTSR